MKKEGFRIPSVSYFDFIAKRRKKENLAVIFLLLILLSISLFFVFRWASVNQAPSKNAEDRINRTIYPTKFLNYNSTKDIIGFLPSWSIAKRTSVDTANFSQIIYFGVGVNEDGELVQYDENGISVAEWTYFNSSYFTKIRAEARENGTKILLAIKSFDNTTIDKIISNENATKNLIRQLVNLINKYNLDGINIDFEYITDADIEFPTSKYLNGFLEEISQNLKKENPEIIISIDVNATAVLTDNAFNMTRIGRAVDQVIIMAYDYRQQNSIFAGPVAPLYGEQNEHSIWESVHALNGRVDSQKIILAVPLYGYEWQTVTESNKSSVIPQSGALATYKRVKEILKERDDVKKHWDNVAKSPWLSFSQYGEIRQIYYEDEKSITEKIKFAKERALGGIAFWALGYEGDDQEIFDIVKKEIKNK
ncbi:MAG: glycoside hydrolase family 18 protein [Candidatus Levybacteria bacterium]|nr:glycoside hydrolase family 18 protein [Candidatus Levybacteria bacterium]